jgi:TRAP-type C4-dicarboxylate transport system substrate-binding protein
MRKLKLPCLAVLGASALFGAHFENAVVVLAGSATTPQKKAAQMLVEEIEKRTQLRLKISPDAAAGAPAIYLRLTSGGKPESFTLTSTNNQVVVAGVDDRGVVFGTGYLLRQFTCRGRGWSSIPI